MKVRRLFHLQRPPGSVASACSQNAPPRCSSASSPPPAYSSRPERSADGGRRQRLHRDARERLQNGRAMVFDRLAHDALRQRPQEVDVARVAQKRSSCSAMPRESPRLRC